MMLTANDIGDLLGTSRTLVYKLMQEHDFPKPIRIGTAVRWDEREVTAWIQARRDARHEVT